MKRIRSVLVGVDVYERPDIPPLSGCVNDVSLVRRTLKGFGVPNEDIRVVVNERATKANIIHRLRTTVADAEPGDVVIFYFSGHGSQIRDRNGDELADSLDEIICPYDMDWDRKTFILDDDLDELFAEIPPDVVLEAFIDCCFWGATPRVLDPDVRYVAPPIDIAFRVEGDEADLRTTASPAATASVGETSSGRHRPKGNRLRRTTLRVGRMASSRTGAAASWWRMPSGS